MSLHRAIKRLSDEVTEIKAALPEEERFPPMTIVCRPVGTDPDDRPVGVYGSEYVFAGDKPDAAVVAWLARPRNGFVPLVIGVYPPPIPPPADLDSGGSPEVGGS